MRRDEWMRREIADWRSKGLVDGPTAETLLARYPRRRTGLSWGAVLAGAFGALLVGLGLIALFAANWDCFGRAARAAIALLPVVCCGLGAAFAAARGKESRFLWEPLGIGWALSVSAATCLVAQTYQIGGTVPALILLVFALVLPVGWVTRSVTVLSLFAPSLSVAWSVAVRVSGGSVGCASSGLVGLLALSVAAYARQVLRSSSRPAIVVGQLATGFVLLVALPVDLGVFICEMSRVGSVVGLFWFCCAAAGLVAVFLKLPVWRTFSILVASFAAMATLDASVPFYLSALVLGLAVSVRGVSTGRLFLANVGSVLLLVLVLGKFFSSSVGFTVKGLALIGTGLALLAMNVALVRYRRRREAK